MKVEWQTPARPNGDIVGYTVYLRDPVQLSINSTALTPEDEAFSYRQTTLHGLAPHHRSVRNELCFRAAQLNMLFYQDLCVTRKK